MDKETAGESCKLVVVSSEWVGVGLWCRDLATDAPRRWRIQRSVTVCCGGGETLFLVDVFGQVIAVVLVGIVQFLTVFSCPSPQRDVGIGRRIR